MGKPIPEQNSGAGPVQAAPGNAEAAVTRTAGGAVPQPQRGGRYVRDPNTRDLTRMGGTATPTVEERRAAREKQRAAALTPTEE